MSKTKILPIVLISVAAVAGAGLVGLTQYARSTQAPGQQPLTQPAHSESHSKPTAQTTIQEPQGEAVMIAVRSGEGYKLVKGQPASSEKKVYLEALNQSFKKDGFTDVRALQVEIEEDTATIDLNAAVLDGLGSEGEADFVKLLQTVISQFEEIKTFRLRVDGRVLDSLGHLDLDDPIKAVQPN